MFLTTAVLIGFFATDALAFTVEVKDGAGNPVSGFRWLVEHDTTRPVVPGTFDPESPGVNIHSSYAPVAASGHADGSSADIDIENDPRPPSERRYVVSVLPDDGYTTGGASVAVGIETVTVLVSRLPLATAQVSVLVFHDHQPMNSAPDVPAEEGLAGFSIKLFDIFGHQMVDAFGNMLGTTYVLDPMGHVVLDDEGAPLVDMMGTGVVLTDGKGEALIQNLAPGKYGIRAVPPGDATDWIQVGTIEGTPTIDAWVLAGEPPYLTEWGFFEWHAFIGFARRMDLAPGPEATGTITGQAVFVHQNKPPLEPGLSPGLPIPDAWVGLNDLDGADELVYCGPCGPDGSFTIENVRPGTYQLVVFDQPLDVIIDFRTVTVPPQGGTVAMGKVAAFKWFGSFTGSIFYDEDGDGFRDPGEMGIRDQAVNIRFTDGSIYTSTATNPMGDYSFNEVFPFFFWLVTEVDFLRFEATGVTLVVDDGGPLEEGEANNPQPQPGNGGLGWRTETGPVLTQGMRLYAGDTNEAHWGKRAYAPGTNGGISGIVFYDTTRAENDPRYCGPEPWQPGVPRVQIALYADSDADGVIDDLDGDGEPTLADVDHWPFDWREAGERGDEDVDRDVDGVFDAGDALNIATTDSFDDNLPDGVGPEQYVGGVLLPSGAETIRTWNQMRPAVFDGGYAFTSYFPGGLASGRDEEDGLPSGYYIVEASPPPGYEIVKEEDKNVDFGESYIPSGGTMMMAKGLPPELSGPPICVGDLREVPAELSLFPGVPAAFGGQMRPLPDRKQLLLADGENAAADFFVFTPVPKAGRIWGVVLNDLLLTFDPASPNKGNNFGVPWIPVSIRNFEGHEIMRVYTDQYGRYNALVPSTFTVNVPAPSGVSPNMLRVTLNDPGPIPDPDNPGQMMVDPWHDPGYGQVTTSWNFLPGKMTFLDTPILPIAAFRGNEKPLDCDFADGTPAIFSVDNASTDVGGPWVAGAGDQIVITAVGNHRMLNPDLDPLDPDTRMIVRDLGFGSVPGTVTVDGVSLTIDSWSADGLTITATIPTGIPTPRGQLMVTRGDTGLTSPVGVTLHVGGLVRTVNPGQSIQAAIDAAPRSSVILIAPGTYHENLILYKAVALQGWGAWSTKLVAGPMPAGQDAVWLARLQSLIDSNLVNLVPGERPDFYLETAPGILVIARENTFTRRRNASIDGITITGALMGGGIFANGWADYLTVSNNILIGNQGNFGGGIRIGTPSLVNTTGEAYFTSSNDNITIHHNLITQNGSIDGGGGIAIFNGADDYVVTDNIICGNFSVLYGGGIAHFGLSLDGLIARNRILNNEAFDEGGGIMVAGELVPAGATVTVLTQGSGSVTIDRNLIQGNLAGDDGGGIRALMINGEDVRSRPRNPRRWYALTITNNLIVNNSSGDAGGGISLDDAAKVFILHNTIAMNDSTSSGVDTFTNPQDLPVGFPPAEAEGGGGISNSMPQVAGIASRAHSAGLRGAFGNGYQQTFPDPLLANNIIWRNRSFYWDSAYNSGFGGLRPDIAGGEEPVYWDLGTYSTPAPTALSPLSCILTTLTSRLSDGSSGTYHASNLAADPLLVDAYVNVFRATSKGAALGNFVSVTFDPTGPRGDYHLGAGSPAMDLGDALQLDAFPGLLFDFDGQPRSSAEGVDAGADQAQ